MVRVAAAVGTGLPTNFEALLERFLRWPEQERSFEVVHLRWLPTTYRDCYCYCGCFPWWETLQDYRRKAVAAVAADHCH